MCDIEELETIVDKLVWFQNNYCKTKRVSDIMRVTGVEFNESVDFNEPFNSMPLVLNEDSVMQFTEEIKGHIEHYTQLLIQEQEFRRNKKWKLTLLTVLSRIFKMRGRNYLT